MIIITDMFIGRTAVTLIIIAITVNITIITIIKKIIIQWMYLFLKISCFFIFTLEGRDWGCPAVPSAHSPIKKNLAIIYLN